MESINYLKLCAGSATLKMVARGMSRRHLIACLLQRNLQRMKSSIYSDVFLASEDIRHRFRGTELPSNPIDVVAGLDG